MSLIKKIWWGERGWHTANFAVWGLGSTLFTGLVLGLRNQYFVF